MRLSCGPESRICILSKIIVSCLIPKFTSMKPSLKYFLILLSFLVISANVFPQGVGIGTNTPDPSAKIDVSSKTQGALLPRMNSIERDAIQNPADGLIIYNNDSKCLNIFKQSSWFELCGNCIAPPSPTASNTGPVCEGNSVNLSASGVTGATYLWTGPNNFSSTQQNPVLTATTINEAGVYSVISIVNNCSSAASNTTVNITPGPNAVFTFNPSTPDSTQSVNFTPSTPNATYSWTFQNGIPSVSSLSNPTVNWLQSGSYPVSVDVTLSGCMTSFTDTVHIVQCAHGSQTFNYTGAAQTFVVPACVSSLTVDVSGAEGGQSGAGLGGQSQGTLSVTGGEVLYIYVGEKGGGPGTNGGWNGGGSAGGSDRGGGGGASDIRRSGNTFNDRVIVAGGGGGTHTGGTGGSGGGLTGGNGSDNNSFGGTQTQAGTGSCCPCPAPVFGIGQDGRCSGCNGSGGGGGYYGGGACTQGGGGSGYIGGVTNGQMVNGIRSGDGVVTISW
jgi:hypothetical protein